MTDGRPSVYAIPQLPIAQYSVDVAWHHLEEFLASALSEGLDLDPDFQRGHVWTDAQASRYVEWILRGGSSGRDLWFNCPRYFHGGRRAGPYELVDGRQRLTAVRRFMRGELPAYDRVLGEYRDRPERMHTKFAWHILELPTRADVLKFYLDLNDGGTAHAESELARVRALLDAAVQKDVTR